MTAPNIMMQEGLPPHNLQPLLDDLFDLLEEEKAHLNNDNADMLEVFARKKMQSLDQLNSFIKKGNMRNTARAYSYDLRRIDNLLKENVRKLKFRMKAIGEIAETIENAVSNADSDGTYHAGSYRVSAKS